MAARNDDADFVISRDIDAPRELVFKAWTTPETYDWNLTVEHRLSADTVFNVSYVGLRGVHLRQDIYLNPRAAGVGTDASRPFQGFIDIFEQRDPDHYAPIAKIATASGARTSLFVPELNRLYLAVPHRGNQKAEIRVYDAQP